MHENCVQENIKGVIIIKTYKHLSDKMFQLDACIQAIQLASKGKKKRRNVQRILSNPTPIALKTINQLKNGTWKPSVKEITILREGAHKKERKIQKPPFDND